MTAPDAAVAAAAAAAAAAAHPVLIGAFFAALGAASYQEVRWRSALNALTLAMASIAAVHLAVAYGAGSAAGLAPPAMLSGVAAAMLGLLRLAGLYGTADWAALSSLFAVLLPAGLHLAVMSVIAGVSLPCMHVVAVCAASNARGRLARGRGAAPGGAGDSSAGRSGSSSGSSGGWLGAAAEFVSCKRRSSYDRWAYAAPPPRPPPSCPPGGPRRGGRGVPAPWKGPRAGRLLGPASRYAGRISPSVPVLAHSCAASAALLAVVGP